jgi:hypothetical protein
MSEPQRKEFLELLKLLVFSHRHNKNDVYLQNPLVNFAIVREPMYKYSRTAQERYFEYSTFTFLFEWFSASPDAHAFSQQKFAENPDTRYPTRMFQEITQLGSEALKALKRSAAENDLKQPLARCLDKYLTSMKVQWATKKKCGVRTVYQSTGHNDE